jgi:hypothetical protein
METIFGVNWEDLKLADVRRYLDGAENEPLLWECKGTDLDPHDIRKAASAFANGMEAGYLILGADETDKGWELNGYEFKDEPPQWVSSVIKDGVRPLPAHNVRDWPVKKGDPKKVAVVRIEPVATPPCFSRGTIYERVPGASPVVKEPTQLAALYARGRAAHENAEGLADRWAKTGRDNPEHPLMTDVDRCRFCLALTATGYKDDISKRLFSSGFKDLLRKVPRDSLVKLKGRPEDFMRPVVLSPRQWGRIAYAEDQPAHDLEVGWQVIAHWSGTVAVQYVTTAEYVEVDRLAKEEMRNALTAADPLVEALGAYGPRYLTIRLHGGSATRTYETRRTVEATMKRGPTDGGPDDLIPSLTRELMRAYEQDVDEPSGEGEEAD